MIRKRRKGLYGLLLFSTLTIGCGDQNMFGGIADKDSKEAKNEELRILLDNGDYSNVVDLLKAKCPDNKCANPEDAKNLAAAYMGQAGLDVIKLIAKADSLKNNSGAGADFSTFSQILPPPTNENIGSMANAVDILVNLKKEQGALSDEQNLQLMAAATSNIILSVGSLYELDPKTGIPTNPPSLSTIVEDLGKPVDSKGVGTTVGDNIVKSADVVTDGVLSGSIAEYMVANAFIAADSAVATGASGDNGANTVNTAKEFKDQMKDDEGVISMDGVANYITKLSK